MSPEQLLGASDLIGPRSDIYSLGCVLYELLTRRCPFAGSIARLLLGPESTPPIPPSAYNRQIEASLDAICLKAIARDALDRYQSMEEFAACLNADIAERLAQPTVTIPAHPPDALGRETNPRVRREMIRFAFAPAGSSAPRASTVMNRLFLGVGNDLRAGVIDQHQLESYGGSTARLLLSNRKLITESAAANRDPKTPFTFVLPDAPDFDCVAAAWLAIAVLTTGELPPGAEALARYADKIDEGSIGHSLANPFSPYAAYMQLVHREARRGWSTDHELWRACVEQGLVLVSYSLERSTRDGISLPSVDAFECADVMTESDRMDVLADVDRYHRKMTDPKAHAQVARLSLPGQFGGRAEVDALVVRDVQNADDADRCTFFKDWARSDRHRSPGGEGFFGLCIFVSETRHENRRAIISVTPDSGATLRGLGELLDRAESSRRGAVYGADNRVVDPVTGPAKPPRAGFGKASPGFDGRAHGFTIVDSPRSRTLLTADEIEAVFLAFGGKA